MKELFIRYRVHLLVMVAFVLGFTMSAVMQPRPAQAIDLGDIFGDVVEDAIKVVGVKAAVDEYGDEINDAINDLMDNNDVSTNAYTKVVVIVTPIGNKHIGAAQVVGPKEAVEKVKAVVQLETSFMDKLFRIKGVVPADSMNPQDFERVPGVGVSAMIDIKL